MISRITQFVIGFCLVLPGIASAGLVVEFEAAPLFSEPNLLPGDAVERTVIVTNTGSESQTVQFDFQNVADGVLADVTELAVDDGAIVWVFGTFESLFDIGPHELGTIEAGASTTYTFSAALPAWVGNEAQSETFGFDILIGFADGQQILDRSVGGGGRRSLSLFNENVVVNTGAGGAFVTWDSNRPASTYLVCGNLANGPFALTDELPLFGYEFSLTEEPNVKTAHGMALTELSPGEYECRPAGRERAGGAYTVGAAVQFELSAAPAGQVAGASISLTEADIREYLNGIIENRPRGSVLGVATKGAGNITYEEFRAEMDELMANRTANDSAPEITPPNTVNDRFEARGNTAAVSDAGEGRGWLSWLFLALLLPLLSWLVWRTLSIS